MKYPKERKLDGVFTRQERNGRLQSVCVSDLNPVELHELVSKKEPEWNRELCDILLDDIDSIVQSTVGQPQERIEVETCVFAIQKALRSIGDQLNIEKVLEDDEQPSE